MVPHHGLHLPFSDDFWCWAPSCVSSVSYLYVFFEKCLCCSFVHYHYIIMFIFKISPFRYVSICLMYLGALILGSYKFRVVIASWWMIHLSLYSDQIFLLLQFLTWGLCCLILVQLLVFSFPFIFTVYPFPSLQFEPMCILNLKWIFYRRRIVGLILSIQSPVLWLEILIYLHLK